MRSPSRHITPPFFTSARSSSQPRPYLRNRCGVDFHLKCGRREADHQSIGEVRRSCTLWRLVYHDLSNLVHLVSWLTQFTDHLHHVCNVARQ